MCKCHFKYNVSVFFYISRIIKKYPTLEEEIEFLMKKMIEPFKETLKDIPRRKEHLQTALIFYKKFKTLT